MRKLNVIAVIALIALVLVLGTASAVAAQGGGQTIIYFFWGDGCPHCAAAKPFLARLAQQYPGVQIRDFEVWDHPENREPFIKMAAKFGFEPSAVPTIFIGERYWVGYAEKPIGQEIEAYVASCARSGCPDAGAGVPGIAPAATARPSAPASAVPTPVLAAPTRTQPSSGPAAAPADPPATATNSTLVLPLIGAVDLATQSLAVSTAIIAFVDGFNPCSLWVLSVLLALTLHTGSRKKVLIIGLVFLTVTSLVYVLFIAGLFTMFTIVSFAPWIRAVVALLALFFAAVNIKDYFFYKEGISFTISDEKKPGLYRSMRRVLNAGESLPALIGATVVMSAGASLVEFSCTAGFPVLWTNLLASQGVTVLVFVALLALYMLIYQIDELAIFLGAVFSLRASKLEEKHGRILKLIGGTLMLTLAAVMLINPNLMSSVGSALVIFVIAFGMAALILLVHRTILPQFGVHIGTEFAGKRAQRRRRAVRE
ncbi:MAG: thioredoxin family protein [Anaerolineae bacterium]|nr:thioredoxin family protein [Anaerolineae bacterium]